MNITQRFMHYAMAFEQTYSDDSWQRLVPFFHSDASYQILNAPFHCELKGRDAIFVGIKKSLDNFDRKCIRKLSGQSNIREEGNNVIVHGSISYQRDSDPASHSSLSETITYQDGKIIRLQDIYDMGEAEKFEAWMQTYGEGLDASYI